LAGPTDESSQVVTFTVNTDNAGLFSAAPAVSSGGTLGYTPAVNMYGTAHVTVTLKDSGGTANGGADTSSPYYFTITVNAVNNAPSFTGGADQTVNEDAGAQSVPGWGTNISAGPANEISQVVTFTVNTDNAGLFSAAPAVSSDGTLGYTPAANVSGTAHVTVTLKDSGGTANSGVDTSSPYYFIITVDAVNDAPSFTGGANQSVSEDAGVQSVPGWATSILAGPTDESSQVVTFTVNTDNAGLFSAALAVSSGGTLGYTPAVNMYGTAHVTVTLKDSGGTANGGADTSSPYYFTVTISGVADTPGVTPATTNEDTQTSSGLVISRNALDGAEVTYFKITNVQHGVLYQHDGITAIPAGTFITFAQGNAGLMFTPSADYNGSAGFQVQAATAASDTGLGGGLADATITVNAVNDPPVNTVSPTVTAPLFVIGQPLTAQSGTWNDTLDGNPAPAVFTYTWQRADDQNGTNVYTITAGSSAVYTLTVAEAHKVMRVKVTARDSGTPGYATTDAYSNWTAVVNTVPVISQGTSTAVTMDEDSLPTSFSLTLNASDADNDTVNWRISSNPAHGTAAASGSGTSKAITYTPDTAKPAVPDYNGTDSFKVEVYDAFSGTDTITVNVTINPRNDAPVNVTAPTIPGGAHVGKMITAFQGVWNDSRDVQPSAVMTYTYQWYRYDTDPTQPPYPVAAPISGATHITYTPAAEDDMKWLYIEVTTTDAGEGLPAYMSTSRSSSPVQVVNNAPVIGEGSLVTALMDEDASPTPFNLTLHAADANGDTLQWTIPVTGTPLHGKAGASGIGTSQVVTYTPTTDYNGLDSFTVKVDDGFGGVDTVLISVTVRARNDAPVNTSLPQVSGTVHVGNLLTATNGDWNDSKDGVPTPLLSFTYQWMRANTAGGSGAAAINGANAITYTVQAADNGKYLAVRVTAADSGVGEPASASASSTSAYVFAANAAPVITEGTTASVTMDEDGTPLAFSLQLHASDPDVIDTLNWSVANQASHGTAAASGTGLARQVTYTPTANYNGSDAFRVQVVDGLGGSDQITVSVTIQAVNDPPTFTVAPSITGTRSVYQTLTALDGEWNDNADLPVPGLVSLGRKWQRADDASGSNTVDIAGETGVTYTLTLEDVHKYIRIQVTAEDNGTPGSASSQAFSPWYLVGINAPSDILLDNASVAENSPVSTTIGTLSTVDLDIGDTHTYSLVSGSGSSDNASFALLGNVLKIKVSPDFETKAAYNIRIRTTDSGGLSYEEAFVVTVTNVNEAPQVSVVNKGGLEDISLILGVADFNSGFSDVERDPLVKVTVITTPTHGVISLDSVPVVPGQEVAAADLDRMAYQPVLDYFGTDSFNWNGSDGVFYAAVASTVNLTIQGVNDAPAFTAGGDVSAAHDAGAQVVQGWAKDMSPGPANEVGQALDFIVVNSRPDLFSAQPVIDALSGDLSFTPKLGVSGSAGVVVMLHDNGGTADNGHDRSDAKTFNIIITSANHNPVANNDTVTTTQMTSVTVRVLENDNDEDGDPLTITALTYPAHGTIEFSNGKEFTYTPADYYLGTDSFSYAVDDGKGGTASALVYVHIIPLQVPVDPVAGGQMVFTTTQGSRAEILFPAGSVTQTVEFRLTALPDVPSQPRGYSLAGVSFKLEAYINGIRQDAYQFSVPFSVVVHYTDADVDGISEDWLSLFYFDTALQQWLDASQTCSPPSVERHPDENWISVQVCHLTEFGLFGRGRFKINLPFISYPIVVGPWQSNPQNGGNP
jgi:hypothetical protein